MKPKKGSGSRQGRRPPKTNNTPKVAPALPVATPDPPFDWRTIQIWTPLPTVPASANPNPSKDNPSVTEEPKARPVGRPVITPPPHALSGLDHRVGYRDKVGKIMREHPNAPESWGPPEVELILDFIETPGYFDARMKTRESRIKARRWAQMSSEAPVALPAIVSAIWQQWNQWVLRPSAEEALLNHAGVESYYDPDYASRFFTAKADAIAAEVRRRRITAKVVEKARAKLRKKLGP